MAKTGDSYKIELTRAPLEWGSYRYTNTRGIIYGEGYLPIPKRFARYYNLLNSNGTNGKDVLGENLFSFSTSDGFITNGYLRAQGCSEAGDIYAKQFAGDGDLHLLGDWYECIEADVGTEVLVEWISPSDIVLSII